MFSIVKSAWVMAERLEAEVEGWIHRRVEVSRDVVICYHVLAIHVIYASLESNL